MGNTTDTFEAFCRDKGLTQADLDMIARELSARVASTTNGKGHYELPPVPDGFRPWSEDAAMVFKEDRSTTNDEQAKYGKEGDRPKQGAKWLPNSETFGHHVILLEQPKREPMLNYDWLGNMDDAAKGYVDNLREPLRSDPVVAGIALEAFKAGRNLPALELAKANTMIDKGVLIMGPWVRPRVCKRSDGLYYRNDPMELAPVTGIFTEITKDEYDRLVSQGAKIIEP